MATTGAQKGGRARSLSATGGRFPPCAGRSSEAALWDTVAAVRDRQQSLSSQVDRLQAVVDSQAAELEDLGRLRSRVGELEAVLAEHSVAGAPGGRGGRGPADVRAAAGVTEVAEGGADAATPPSAAEPAARTADPFDVECLSASLRELSSRLDATERVVREAPAPAPAVDVRRLSREVFREVVSTLPRVEDIVARIEGEASSHFAAHVDRLQELVVDLEETVLRAKKAAAGLKASDAARQVDAVLALHRPAAEGHAVAEVAREQRLLGPLHYQERCKLPGALDQEQLISTQPGQSRTVQRAPNTDGGKESRPSMSSAPWCHADSGVRGKYVSL